MLHECFLANNCKVMGMTPRIFLTRKTNMCELIVRFEDKSEANMHLTDFFLERTQNKAIGKCRESFVT